jgi:hypothetical protein
MFFIFIFKKSLPYFRYPNATPVVRIVEGGETPLFKQNFDHWPEKDASKGPGKGTETKKFEKKVFDTKSLHGKVQRDAYIMPDNGTGKLEIWRVENFELAPWPKEKYGEFYSGDSFVMLYTYLVNSKENYIIYFWQGLDSSQVKPALFLFLALTNLGRKGCLGNPCQDPRRQVWRRPRSGPRRPEQGAPPLLPALQRQDDCARWWPCLWLQEP